MDKRLVISKKIRDDYGTLVCFCKKHDLNLNTFKQVLYGYAKSKPITDLLIKKGYLNIKD
ncbi:hypothetical protein [Campylobacter ureolyticus]|uniref:hypothetical protein n=1 Tax=Campylobacter ureolyticus TaxID=827 RepID=UPI001FC7D162|nr:hypothetical protein [Campylobacter ureolyticus]MCZ6135595.1 hypothetical protein [Campylobacter ureolyticus]GKH61213.1 hypothetical protein CE91St25_15490 [Campylobacter ureolyticus]